MEKKEWLENLKVGDRVIVESSNNPRLEKVERITKTMIILHKHSRFDKKWGSLMGGGVWCSTRIVEPTEKVLKEYHIAWCKIAIYNYIDRGSLSNLSLERLQVIRDVLKEGQKD